MVKIVYFIRHSSPFVTIDNYLDYEYVLWKDYNRNMILSPEGEEKAKELCYIEELHNISEIYASDSYRAIGTAKYLADYNNTNIKLDERINERELGVRYLNELPEDFNKKSFKNKDYKLSNGESLNEVDERLNSFINDFLKSNHEKCIILFHGIMLLSFLQNYCDFYYEDDNIMVNYKEKSIVNKKPNSPGVYKILFDDKTVVDITCINKD